MMPNISRVLSENNLLHIQFFRFLIYAGIAAAANLSGRWLLSHTGITFSLAVAISYCAGMIVNFILNKYFNFRNHQRPLLHQARTFIMVAVVGLLLTQGLSILGLYLFQSLAFYLNPEDAAHLCAVALVMFYSFICHRFFTFNSGFRGRLRSTM